MNNWIKWNGGKCPVDGDVMVEVKSRGDVTYSGLASSCDWRHDRCISDIIKYRILSEEQPTLVDQVAKAQSEINNLKEQAQKANDALVKANDELDRMIKRLEQEITDKTGLSCVIGVEVHEPVKVDSSVEAEKTKQLAGIPDGVDIDDWRTWKAGDVIQCLDFVGNFSVELTIGSLYLYDGYDKSADKCINITNDDNGNQNGFHERSCKFRFVRRP